MARGDSRDGSGAIMQVAQEIFKPLLKANPHLKPYAETWRYGSEDSPVRVPTRLLNKDLLTQLRDLYRTNGGSRKWQWPLRQVDGHLAVLDDPDNAKMEKLRPFETAAIAWLRRDIINGWVHVKDAKTGILQAWLAYDVCFHPAYQKDGYYYPAHTDLELHNWSKSKVRRKTFKFHQSDISGMTVAQIMEKVLVFHETKALSVAYEKAEKEFLAWRHMLGEQFVGDGEFTKEDRWDEHDHAMKGTRLIVDDKCPEIDNHMTTMLFRSHDVDDGDDDPGEGIDENEDKYTRLPLGHYIWCFNLHSHRGGWVHSNHMKPYVYRPELREKLILAAEHEDLIDALTADMDVLMEDIVSGKSGGTTILCQGKAGTGKTLTAEVYAEVVKRPLYRVHSGQLGTNAESVEKGLQDALNNAKRWRALLLIDEGDVFVSQRDNNLEKNAVVGVFLRLLEYYDGILFITTNRVDTVDEAILSRCIAQIQYKMPGLKERTKIWETLGGVYGLKMVADKGMAAKLATEFECSGRDIKGLIRLVTKYSRQKNRKPEFADFKRLATFKGL